MAAAAAPLRVIEGSMDKDKALAAALSQIERNFGKGSVMKLGEGPIAQIESMNEPDEMFDAKVNVLGEYIDHHVKEERNEIFPKARGARKLDLVAMRDEIEARKEELLAEAGAPA